MPKPTPITGDTWVIESLEDAYKPRPAIKYLVNGVLMLPGLVAPYGAPGSLKSMVMADLAACIAGGKYWLPSATLKPPMGFQTTQAPVLWIDFDNGKRRTAERLGAVSRARKLPADAPLYYVSMPSPWLDVTDLRQMSDLSKRILHYGAKLIVIDNLGLISGNADENSAEMARVMGNLRYLAEQTDSVVAVIHHQRKSNGFKSRAGESLRGHSSIEAAVDLALLIEREPGSMRVEIQSTKTRGMDVPRLGAEFTFTHQPGTDELDECNFYGVIVDDSTSDDAIKQAIVDVLTTIQPLTKTALKSEVKKHLPDIGLNRIGATIEKMTIAGELKEKNGNQKNAKLYELP